MTAEVLPTTARSRWAWPLLRPRMHVAPSIQEGLRIERVIAVARLLLTVLALLATRLGPIAPPRYVPVVLLLLVLFAAHSLSALFVLRTRQRTTRAFVRTVHTVDLVAAAVTLPMAAPTNPFFSFFLFALASAAFRWGFRETVATTVVAITLVLVHARLAESIPALSFTSSGEYPFDTVIFRTTYLALVGMLLAFLADEGRRLRAETAAINALLANVRVHASVTRGLSDAAREIATLVHASQLLVVLEDLRSRRLFRWDSQHGWAVLPPASGEHSAAEYRNMYLFGSPTRIQVVKRRRWLGTSNYRSETVALDATGRAVEFFAGDIPEAFPAAHPFRRMVAVPLSFGDDLTGRMFVLNPQLDVRLIELARFLQTLVQQVAPALFNVYLSNQLRAKAGALERARVARELHDGVIQSLIGLEMRLDVLRRSDTLKGTTAADELSRLQVVARDEVVALRDLMQQMRPSELDPDELLDNMADFVQRFSREAGIAARFVTQLQDVRLPRRVCFELLRIVQEALVNVRKHSEAKNVQVRFDLLDGYWHLSIDDDGRGFPFAGRLELAELDASGRGPSIIKERVHAIGGQMSVQSTPGGGSRLEIHVPHAIRG